MASDDPVGAVVAANLRQMRQQRRWTLKGTAERLALKLGGNRTLSESTLSRWENPSRPRRFSMTELFAICSVFEVPLARLFLPDRHQEIPTINGEHFHAVWNACFSRTETYLPDWQLVEQAERHPQGRSSELGLDDDVARAYERMRRVPTSPVDGEGSAGKRQTGDSHAS